MENKKRYTTYTSLTRVYKDNEGKNKVSPYIIIEGNLTRDVELKTGKSSYYVFTSIGTNVSAAEVYARAKGNFNKDIKYNENTFINLKFFGKTAERLAKIGSKGLRLIVWGNAEEESYNDSQNNPKKSIAINVDNFIPVFKSNGKAEESSTEGINGFSTSEELNNNFPNEAKEEDEMDDDDDIPF